LDDIDYSVMTLKRLRESGVSIAIDDFGTGYSSLSYLRKLPVDVLKIDKSFIDDIDDESAAELINTIITIGKQLSLDIVAEGTETREQVDKVEKMGCNNFQGYFFSKPLPPEQIPSWKFQA
jgi:sensor c-di-GMP phosphodiesterase-like protein